jgi:hypothetical protein
MTPTIGDMGKPVEVSSIFGLVTALLGIILGVAVIIHNIK